MYSIYEKNRKGIGHLGTFLECSNELRYENVTNFIDSQTTPAKIIGRNCDIVGHFNYGININCQQMNIIT